MHKYSLEDGVHHVLDFILVLLKLQTEKHQFPLESGTNAKLQGSQNTKLNFSSTLKREQVSHVSDTPNRNLSPTSFLFCSSSSSFSFARLPMILFLSASYCLWVLSWWILRFSATFTSAVISFMAMRNRIIRIIHLVTSIFINNQSFV